MSWMLMPLRRYADFEGRSRRKEYWSWVLFNALLYAVLWGGLGYFAYDAFNRVDARGGVHTTYYNMSTYSSPASEAPQQGPAGDKPTADGSADDGEQGAPGGKPSGDGLSGQEAAVPDAASDAGSSADTWAEREADRDGGWSWGGAMNLDPQMFFEEFSPIGWVLLGLAALWNLFTFIPALAVTIRRLHDTNRSGWMILLGLIPLVGGIILLVFMFSDGTPGANRFGRDPKERNGVGAFT